MKKAQENEQAVDFMKLPKKEQQAIIKEYQARNAEKCKASKLERDARKKTIRDKLLANLTEEEKEEVLREQKIVLHTLAVVFVCFISTVMFWILLFVELVTTILQRISVQ